MDFILKKNMELIKLETDISSLTQIKFSFESLWHFQSNAILSRHFSFNSIMNL